MQCTDTTIKLETTAESFQAQQPAPSFSSVKQYLATSNTYPAGLIANAVVGSIRNRPWSGLSDIEWRTEVMENSWALITILLRVNQTGSNSSFLILFVDIESDYKAAVKRYNWVTNNSKDPVLYADALATGLDEKFSELESKFIHWAIKNRDIVQQELDLLIKDSSLNQGNALLDLESFRPIWFAVEK